MNSTNTNIKTKDETQTKRKNKYVAGDKIGPYETEHLQRLENRRGIFKCSFCGQKFESSINNVARGSKKSCGCQNSIINPVKNSAQITQNLLNIRMLINIESGMANLFVLNAAKFLNLIFVV